MQIVRVYAAGRLVWQALAGNDVPGTIYHGMAHAGQMIRDGSIDLPVTSYTLLAVVSVTVGEWDGE